MSQTINNYVLKGSPDFEIEINYEVAAKSHPLLHSFMIFPPSGITAIHIDKIYKAAWEEKLMYLYSEINVHWIQLQWCELHTDVIQTMRNKLGWECLKFGWLKKIFEYMSASLTPNQSPLVVSLWTTHCHPAGCGVGD